MSLFTCFCAEQYSCTPPCHPPPDYCAVLASTILTPEALMQAFYAVEDDFLGAEWHVVFKGKHLVVYLAW